MKRASSDLLVAPFGNVPEDVSAGAYINKRTYPTRQLTNGDYVFFIVALQKIESQSRPNWIDPEWSYNIIGYFNLESPVPIEKNLLYPLSRVIIQRFPNNAHILRDYQALKDHYDEN